MLDKLIALDTNIFLWLNGFNSPFWDKFMWYVSGKLEWLPLYIILTGYIIYCYRWRSIAILVAIGIAITLADQLSVIAFKETFQRFRPTHNPEISHLVHVVNDYRGGSFGFISNHAANSFALASYLCLLVRKKYFNLALILWALLVSYSRIYLGVHYPGDILGGAIFGCLIGWLIYLLYTSAVNYIPLLNKEKAVNG
jgi:undecaprenyl-diphosphatase